ncbi:MFS general substrate transporter [Apiospora rasikravindrae]|uniref:MFS general substrate transporter n=1 Tax=Apiospora rasikravindrae TaxID=990691 RepID=A0ABR1S0J5_9PEZI
MTSALSKIVSLFMIQAEASVTSTAVTAITNDLGNFEKNSWIFSSYLLTYSAFPIFLAKISDIFGRKQVLLCCIVSFIAFSGACGGAQTFLQLIMFRWIKGLGAGGISAICIGYGFELRPPSKWPVHSALLMMAASVSMSISPLIGAAFTQVGQWRWCFLMKWRILFSVPIGVTAFVLLFFAMPRKLKLEPAATVAKPGQRMARMARLDYPGLLMFVGATVFLMTALQQAAQGVSYSSPEVLTLLILTPCFLACFLLWQWLLSRRSYNLDPILSWSLLTNRLFISTIANAWLSGMAMTVTVVQIPQRFVLVHGFSAIRAGVSLLPFAAVMSFTSVVLSVIMTKSKVPALYTLLFGACIEVAGLAGLSQVSTQGGDPRASEYGFQVLAAVGLGIYNVILLLMTPHVVEKKDLGTHLS